MKTFLTFIIFLWPFSALAEMYYCTYNQFETTKIITFDRVTHSHFKTCNSESCDKNRYAVIYADENNLIFGNIVLTEEVSSDGFQLFIIDKRTNSFNAAKISLPTRKINNQFIKGECIVN